MAVGITIPAVATMADLGVTLGEDLEVTFQVEPIAAEVLVVAGDLAPVAQVAV